MKQVQWIYVVILLCLQILFASIAFCQTITATYNENNTGIIINNMSKNSVYVFQNNTIVKDDYKRRTCCGQELADNMQLIETCDLFKYDGGNKKYIEIDANKNKEITFKNTKYSSSSFFCYEKIDGLISKEYSVTIKPYNASNSGIEENNGKSTTTSTDNPKNTNTSTSTTSIAPGQASSTKSKQGKTTKSEVNTKVKELPKNDNIIKKYNEEYQELYIVCKPLLNKGKLNSSKEERAQLAGYQKRVKTLKEKAEKIAPSNSIRKTEKQALLTEIQNLDSEISELLSTVDAKKIQEKYDEEIVTPQKQILSQLQNAKNKLDAEILLTEKKSGLVQWRDKDTLLVQITVLEKQMQIDSIQFEKSHQNFIHAMQIEENENTEILGDFVSKQKESIMDKYDDLTYRIGERKSQISAMHVPYTKIVIFSAILLVIIIAIIFYIRAHFKKKTLKVQAQKSLEYNIRPIEIDEITQKHVVHQDFLGLAEIKEQAGADYYPIDMNDIFDDTTIQTIYIKRKCIVDIYRFFSEFLKLSGKTNEIGCFIVGQWEYASLDKNTYNISLEEIIEPGGDVIYGEYELDFGVEIGVGLESTIFNLRQKTGKEYVHTSWMHSHPGLGLFLSNHDLNVQGQLAYSEHKNRMLAIVIDSNTENLNMAFFAPKKDGSMNNKEELKKELSLENLFQWVKKSFSYTSEKQSLPDYYEFASNNPNSKIESVFFSGSAIVEMDHVILPNMNGLAGYFFGRNMHNNAQKWTLIENFQVVNIEKQIENEPSGCFLIVSEYAYHDIINKYEPIIDRYDFFVIYQPSNDSLRLITKCEDNRFPESDINVSSLALMDMKKWTRRKRE